MKRFYDVSMLINEDIIVYPGNEPVSIEQYAYINGETPVNESKITMGCHTGTHVDAPYHISKEGKKADEISLSSFYGPCKVLDLTGVDHEIHKEDLKGKYIGKNEIVLFKTQNSLRGYKKFREDFVHVKMDAAEYLLELGVKTLGIDYLSVKKFGGDDEVHELLINNLTLFEGLDLSEIKEDRYLFMGLPLRLHCDGAPARVILIKN